MRAVSRRRQQCDVLLNPNLLTVDLLNFRAYDLAMQIGYDCEVEKIEQIKRRISDKVAVNVTSSLLTAGLPVLSGQ